MRDVFYYGDKPNVHPREQYAESFDDARQKSTTEHFWIINEFGDYRGFDWDWDFEFLPDEDVWAEKYCNIWPSQHQKDSGTWLCSREEYELNLLIYRNDVNIVKRKNEKNECWVELDKIDHAKFDFSWHPDPTDIPYIYKWGSKFAPVQLKTCLEYHVEGATAVKYMTSIVELLPETDRWVEHQAIDKTKFDMSWRPDPLDPPFIYIWGNKYIDGRLKPTLEYRVPDATDIKYMPDLIPVLPEWDRWIEIQAVDKTKFDFSWRPDPREPAYIYVWGNKYIDGILKPTLEYHCPDATEVKYMTNDVAVLPEWDRWKTIEQVDVKSFDFTWRPDPREPDLIYVFGNEHYDGNIMPTLEYHMPNATERKYINDIKVKLLSDKSLFEHLENATGIDYSWRPDPTSPPYIYVWGNQWNKPEDKISIQYTVAGATEYKYMDKRATRLPTLDNWQINDQIDVSKFDFSWEPNPADMPYIYQFGTQWQKTGGPQYVMPGATAVKYIDIIKSCRLPDKSKFKTLGTYKIKNFDYSWHPDDTAPAYSYQFGSNWYSVEDMPVIEYMMKNATEVKFVNDVLATLDKNMANWEINDDIDVANFDFSWVPHPHAPPYVYQFGTRLDNTDGPSYVTPNNIGEIVYLPRLTIDMIGEVVVKKYYIETTLDDLVNQHPDELFWAMRKNIDYTSFNFDWRPDTVEISWELDFVHVFGSPESEVTQTYFVSSKNYIAGKTSFKFVEEGTTLDDKTLFKLFKKSDMFYVDRGNSEAQSRFDMLKTLYPQIQKTRYLNSWVDTINRCTNRSTTELFWVLNSELDYNGFDFEYYPNPWQMKMVNVFGTQWSHWGTTFMVNRESFSEDTKYIKIIEHLSNINFVKNIRAKATQCVYDIVVIDHGNRELDRIVEQVKSKISGKNVTTVKYNESYLKTLKDIVARLPEKKEHYLWLCSSVCDYSSFDFSYVCDPFAKDNLHVFASGSQKFGDTFLIDVNKTKEIIEDMTVLEDYHKVNYNGAMKANRLPEPIIVTSNDTLVDAAINIEGFPYATIITSDNKDISVIPAEPMNLWAPETKNILITSTGATRITVPREAKDHVKKELYDYPYIKKASKISISSPMDIVYLSNGETGAEENWEHLQKITQGLKNRVVRVDGVNGRVQAYHAALEASETPWAFTVFAKLKISPKFDFNWQPDRMQVAKHYVFHAKNPVNGLIYGHQAMILYHKKLVLANKGTGLDFTLDDEHEVVPLLSGIANYNTDEFSTWRTSFREVLKLKAEDSEISRTRLDAWLNKAEGNFSQHSIKGAIDADEYYDEVDGDFEMLKLSYEWAWLKEKFANS